MAKFTEKDIEHFPTAKEPKRTNIMKKYVAEMKKLHKTVDKKTYQAVMDLNYDVLTPYQQLLAFFRECLLVMKNNS